MFEVVYFYLNLINFNILDNIIYYYGSFNKISKCMITTKLNYNRVVNAYVRDLSHILRVNTVYLELFSCWIFLPPGLAAQNSVAAL